MVDLYYMSEIHHYGQEPSNYACNAFILFIWMVAIKGVRMRVWVHVCVRVCVRAWVRACVRACVRVCVCVCQSQKSKFSLMMDHWVSILHAFLHQAIITINYNNKLWQRKREKGGELQERTNKIKWNKSRTLLITPYKKVINVINMNNVWIDQLTCAQAYILTYAHILTTHYDRV